MVRFQAAPIPHRYGFDLFQFQNGAIPSGKPGKPYPKPGRFNSKMVRFQARLFWLALEFPEVSIPKWCDSKRAYIPQYRSCQARFNSKMVRFQENYLFSLLRSFPVSIPKWCDSKDCLRCRRRWRFPVSIPKWCDSKDRGAFFCPYLFEFQFQNGAIPSVLASRRGHGLLEFQFQNGAIPSHRPPCASTAAPRVSIPKWCDSKKCKHYRCK